MRTVYQCEVCGRTHTKMDDAVGCEGVCRLANMLKEIFGVDQWTPPPLNKFHYWPPADRAEMARRLQGFITRHFT